MVNVKFFGIPKCHLNSIDIPVGSEVVFDVVLEEASKILGLNLKEIMVADRALKKNIFILVNGKRLDEQGGLTAKITPGDKITISKLLLGG